MSGGQREPRESQIHGGVSGSKVVRISSFLPFRPKSVALGRRARDRLKCQGLSLSACLRLSDHHLPLCPPRWPEQAVARTRAEAKERVSYELLKVLFPDAKSYDQIQQEINQLAGSSSSPSPSTPPQHTAPANGNYCDRRARDAASMGNGTSSTHVRGYEREVRSHSYPLEPLTLTLTLTLTLSTSSRWVGVTVGPR